MGYPNAQQEPINSLLSLASAASTSRIQPVQASSRSLGATGLVDLVRRAQRLQAGSIRAVFYGQALDDEAAEDEELYLVGIAVEKDALVLHQLASDGPNGTPAGPSTLPGIRIRTVSPTVSFVFYKSSPYDFHGIGRGDGVYATVKGLMDDQVAEGILNRFYAIEGEGLPIFSPEQQANDYLKAFCLTAGLIYTPSLRTHHKSAYVATMSKLRQRGPRARLWALQVFLLDLNGREAIDPSGNFITLGLAVSIACLLGLNEDCSDWSIPDWEKDLRIRLWWALWVYDVLSALSFGRTRSILFHHTVPLPARGPGNFPHECFMLLCELAIVLDKLQAESRKDTYLDSLSDAATSLDRWHDSFVSSGVLLAKSADNVSPPGVQSLHLAYLGSNLTIVREIWNLVGTGDPVVQQRCQETCLAACVEIVAFVHGLEHSDLRGYWASYCPFILSFCLTLLVRLIVTPDRQDQSDTSIWQMALFNLRKFITALTKARNDAQWDIAELALARASHFIPLLARRTSEFQVALLPLGEEASMALPTAEEQIDHSALDDFLAFLHHPNDLEQMMAIPAFPELGFHFEWRPS